MALTVDTDLSTIDLANALTNWDDGAVDLDFFVQGTGSIGWYASKNSRSAIEVDPTDVSWSTGDHLYFWMNSSVAAKCEDQTTGTTTASGLTVRVTLSNGAYREWHVAGADTWDGGWRCFVVELDYSTGDQLYASSGTFSTASDIDHVTFYFDLSNSGNIRNVPANTWNDAVRVGTGVTAYNSSAADPSFDFRDVAAIAEATAQAYGVSETKDGVVFLQGNVTLGDTGTDHLDFASTDETVVFSLRDGADGYGFVGDSLYGISFVGNSTGSDQDVQLGVKVGTGDAMTGRNGTKIQAGGSGVVYSVDLSDSNLHTVGWYGSTIAGATDGVTTSGAPTTTFELGGVTFDGCEQVDYLDAVARNLVVLNTTAAATSGAVLYVEDVTDTKNSLFVNNTRAWEITTLTDDITMVGMEYQGNTFDVQYEGSGDYDLNWSDAPSAPTVNDAGTGTLTPVNTVNTTIKNVPSGAEWRLYEANPTQGIIGSTELDGAESHTGGNIVYADAYSTDTNAALQVLDDAYEEYLLYFVLGAAPQTITVVLTPETNT